MPIIFLLNSYDATITRFFPLTLGGETVKKKNRNALIDAAIGLTSLVILYPLVSAYQLPIMLISASFTIPNLSMTILMFIYIVGVVGLIFISYKVIETVLVLIGVVLRFTSKKQLKRYKKYMVKGQHVYFKRSRKLIHFLR